MFTATSLFVILYLHAQGGSSVPVGDPFGPVMTRKSPIWDCRSSGPGAATAIPTRPNCSEVSQVDTTRVEGMVTIWKVDTSAWKIEGCECFTEQVTATCVSPLFGLPSKSTRRVFVPTNKEACLSACNDISSSDLMQSKVKGVVVSGKEPSHDCPWWGKHQVAKSIMSVMRLQLMINHDNDAVTGPVNFAVPCFYKDEVCTTLKSGYVSWNAYLTQEKRCNLVSTGVSEICSMHGTRFMSLHCPITKTIFHLGVHSVVPTVACSKVKGETSKEVYKTLEGIWISGHTSKSKNIAQWMEQVRGGRGADIITKPMPRVQGTHVLGLTGPQMSWLEAAWAERTTKSRIQEEMEICKEATSNWDLAWSLRKLAPQISAGMWIKSPNTVATVYSGFLLSWPCKPLNQYRFMKNPNCSENWPIEYSDGISLHKGFLEPISFHIVRDQGRANCRISPGFLYPVNDSHVVNLATKDFMPVPNSFFSMDRSPTIEEEVFYSPALYSVEELGGNSRTEDMIAVHQQHLKKTIYALSNSYDIANDEVLTDLAPISSASSFFGTFFGDAVDKVANTALIAILLGFLSVSLIYGLSWFTKCPQFKLCLPSSKKRNRRPVSLRHGNVEESIF